VQTGEGALRQASPRRQRVETWLAEGAALLTPQQYRARALAELAHSASFRDLQQRASARAGAGGAARLAAHRSNYMPPLPAEPDEARAGEPAGGDLLPRAVSAPHALMRPPAVPAPLESTAEEPAGDRWADDSGAASAEDAGESAGCERGEAGWLCRSWPWRALCAAGAAAGWPLLVLRRASIPALAPDCYDRRWLVAALAGGPVFAAWCALDAVHHACSDKALCVPAGAAWLTKWEACHLLVIPCMILTAADAIYFTSGLRLFTQAAPDPLGARQVPAGASGVGGCGRGRGRGGRRRRGVEPAGRAAGRAAANLAPGHAVAAGHGGGVRVRVCARGHVG